MCCCEGVAHDVPSPRSFLRIFALIAIVAFSISQDECCRFWLIRIILTFSPLLINSRGRHIMCSYHACSQALYMYVLIVCTMIGMHYVPRIRSGRLRHRRIRNESRLGQDDDSKKRDEKADMRINKEYHTDADIDASGLTPGERRRLRRKKEADEKAERRREEQERWQKKNQSKSSDKVMAKWHRTGGVAVDGQPIRNMFYSGANMTEMVHPEIEEPSLINPRYKVAKTSEGAEPLPEFPMYELLSDEQRRGYIEFMASDRTQADDIGYVFIYLMGFERRLILDASKPGEVSKDEREDLTRELVRLYRTFGSRSRSLCHYIALLLLYDGTAFDILSDDELDEIFELSSHAQSTSAKSREATDSADAMSYMLVSRLKERGIKVPTLDLIAAAKGRLLRGSNAASAGITSAELYDEQLDRLLRERVSFVDMGKLARASAVCLTPPRRPVYHPASMTIRMRRAPEITSAVCKDPEDMGIPLKGLADMIKTSKEELDECRTILETSSIRDIDRVQFDALDIVSGSRGDSPLPLDEFLRSKSGATYVPVSVLEEDMKRRFKVPLSYTSKGIMSTNSQNLIAAAAATLGWQAMLPDVIDGMVSSYWRIDKDSRIVMFERGTAHNRKNGKRCIGPVFGRDEQSFRLVIPGDWNRVSCLAYVFAWFISKCPNSLDKSYLNHFSKAHYPTYNTEGGGYKNNQIAFFFCLLHATYSLKLSTHGIKACIQGAIDFADVQDVIFSLCDEVYGKMIPQEAMEAIEDIYKKAGKDPAMILYDYNSGVYQVTSASDSGFAIDEEKLADTIADTAGVQSILNEAMNAGEDDEIMLDDGARCSGSDSIDFGEIGAAAGDASGDANDGADNASDGGYGADGIADAESSGEPASDGTDVALDIIKGFFEDGDEGQAADLMAAIVEAGLATTQAEAMGVISRVNDQAGEEIVEIDGSNAYWNG